MTLTDEQRERCRFENILKGDAYDGGASYRKLNEEQERLLRFDQVAWYSEAIAFIIGMHPDGRFAHLEDMNYSSTENGIMMFMGPAIVDPIPPIVIEPEEFIGYFMGTNECGEGTPIFVDNEIH
jgi:hypothetical protein